MSMMGSQITGSNMENVSFDDVIMFCAQINQSKLWISQAI